MSDLYTYKAIVTDIYDGDTITVDIDLGFYTWIMSQKLRLFGIDTPELRGDERPYGLMARDALREFMPLGSNVRIHTHGRTGKGKYGRWIATIYHRDISVNDWLVSQGHAAKVGY